MELELTEREGPITMARLTGRLDTAGADRIGIRMTAGVVSQSRPALVDLSGVTFVSSMGIRLLLSCAKAMKIKGQTMAVFGARPAVQEVFEQSGLEELLDIVPDEPKALALLDR
jgi:anti-anti-sigma factor